jgi:DNA ligase-1
VDSFASVADEVAATKKRLEKRSILAAYLQDLTPEELPVAAVFLTGRPFPLRSEATVNVGGALLREAAVRITGADAAEYNALLVRLGDTGEAIAELLASSPSPSSSLTLLEARRLYELLADLATADERTEALAGALRACRPAAAKYLVKIITSGMRIGVQESLVEEAMAAAFGRDPDGVRRANMLIGDIGQTALLAREDRLEEARLTLFRPLKFMLATAIEEPADALEIGPEWLVEDKYDGIRAQVHCDGQQTRIYSRTLDEITEQFPEVVGAFDALGQNLLCDGEIIAGSGERRLGFNQLSKRLGRKRPGEQIIEEIPAVFIAFDLLAANGEALLRLPLTDRRARLEEAVGASAIPTSELVRVCTEETIRTAFGAALERGNEGLVLKDPTSAYQPGKRGRGWLKLKRPLATLDVVVVAAEYGHGKRRGLLSDYTFAVRDGNRLATVGKAYSGVTDREIAFLTDHFKQRAVKEFATGVVVPPTIVVEVAFNGVNKSSRHPSGFALRFPRIKRLRLDKPPQEIDTLGRVRELWGKQRGGT